MAFLSPSKIENIKILCSAHYLVNIILAVSYLFLKHVSPFCAFLFPSSECYFDHRDSQVYIFIMVIVGARTRKTGSTTMLPYIASICKYVKIGNSLLYFLNDPRLGIIYVVLCIVHLIFLPEPVYKGPESIVYFRDNTLEEELTKDRRVNWIIAFYAPWHPTCVTFAPTFAQLSLKYSLENFKFGKIDVSRFPAVATKYNINTSPMSLQLPTIILFENGVPTVKRPTSESGKFVKFYFNEVNMTLAFDLPEFYEKCKNNPIKKRKAIEHSKDD